MKKTLASFIGFLILAVLCGPVAAYSHANSYGGSTSHAYGGGTEHTNMYGGSTEHGWYGGTTTGAYGAGAGHTMPYGATTAYHSPYYGATYPAYHPPTTVNVYGSSCYNCGGWSTAGAAAAGAMVGMAVGAAATSPAAKYAVGAIYATLPAGCTTSVAGSTSYYYQCAGAWFQPGYGANGVYYRVVTGP